MVLCKGYYLGNQVFLIVHDQSFIDGGHQLVEGGRHGGDCVQGTQLVGLVQGVMQCLAIKVVAVVQGTPL